MPTAADLALLTGPEAEDVLRVAVESAGGELVAWRPKQVDHRPGCSTTAAYGTQVRWSTGTRSETLAARAGTTPVADQPGVVRVSGDGREIAVWRYPVDPDLPGLTAACDPGSVRRLLAASGVEAGRVSLRTLSYRPGRRAVVEVTTDAGALVIKAVRPTRVAALHARHRVLADAGVPVPRSLGWTDDGLVVMTRLPGTSLRERLRVGGSDLPRPEDLLELLDRLPAAVLDLPRRAPWSEHAAHYALLVGAALPAEAGRAADLAGEVLRRTRRAPGEPVPTHGDLYEAQLLVTGPAITGVLDVDTAGPGNRADDLACVLAHLSVLTLLWSGRAVAVSELVEQWWTAFARTTDPADLGARAAGVLLSLATGPHRVQDVGWQLATTRRLDLVERWLERGPTP